MKAISGRDFIRLLEKHGWVLLRYRGSHFMFQKEGHPLLIVPVHANRPMKTGTLKGLLKAAGLGENDLTEA